MQTPNEAFQPDGAFILQVTKYAVWCIGIFFISATIVGVFAAWNRQLDAFSIAA
jgi:hypothetical protein